MGLFFRKGREEERKRKIFGEMVNGREGRKAFVVSLGERATGREVALRKGEEKLRQKKRRERERERGRAGETCVLVGCVNMCVCVRS